MRIPLVIAGAVFSALAITAVFAQSVSNDGNALTGKRHHPEYTKSGDLAAVTDYGQADTRSQQYSGAAAAVVDDKGNLRVPADYRTTYQTLGSWAVAKDDGPGSKQLHVVYASPGTIAAYRKDGHFPDGTVLVKEVFNTTTKAMTTGTVSSAGTLAGWFVMVKDDVGRFPGNKLWGDGWGWSWFDASNPWKTTSTDYMTDCKSCHLPARASDWIYTRGYPPLNR